MVPPSRSFRYSVCPLSRWPEPGITLTVVIPPACAFWICGLRTSTESSTRTSGWRGALASAPSTDPMWLWVSTSPGRMTLPATSRRAASAGTDVVAASPMATMRPRWTTRTPFGISGPSIGTRRAPTNATGASWDEAERGPTTRIAARSAQGTVRFNGPPESTFE